MQLAGKVAVITGSSRGIGRAVAMAMARAGARVVINYAHDDAAADAVVDEITVAGGTAVAVAADMSAPVAVDYLVNVTLDTYGRLDVWMNNAGADVLTGPARMLPAEEQLRLLLDLDVMGTFYGSRAAAAAMQTRHGGSIINIAWDHIEEGYATTYGVLFGTAKGGVLGMSTSMARLYAPTVRVNVLAPGWIKTAWGKEGVGALLEARIIGMTPLARWGEPDDIANTAVFLASDASNFITGQVLAVNGGVVMG